MPCPFCSHIDTRIHIQNIESDPEMATAVGMIGAGSRIQLKGSSAKKRRSCNQRPGLRVVSVSSSYSAAVAADPYQTLRIQPNASESEVRKAFRKLALQYHPDVCRGSNCGVQFHLINEAYDVVMKNLRGETSGPEMEVYESYDEGVDESMRGMDDPDWDMWEEWMGWEGAGIRDYSSHINPYI